MQEKVIIITLNYNQNEITKICIDSILKSNYLNFEIFLIDNGSQKSDYDSLVKTYNNNRMVRIFHIDKNCGYVNAINFALQKAKKIGTEYYLIMNNDTVIDKSAITILTETALRHKNNCIVSGKIYYYDRPNIIQHTGSIFKDKRYLKEVYPGKNENDIGQCEEEIERDMLDDIFWLIPNSVFNNVGFYCNYFFLYGEQADYALRAKRMGYKLIYNPKANIWHKGSQTTGDGDHNAPPVNFWRNKSEVIFLYRNLERKYFFIWLVKTFPKLILKVILNKLRFRKTLDYNSELAALIGYIHGVKWMFNKKPDYNGYNPFINKKYHL